MNMTDTVGDMLTRLRNANMARLDAVEMPHSALKAAIAKVLKKEGFIRDYIAEGGGAGRVLRVYMKYVSGRKRVPVIRGIRRVSRPGLRVYAGKDKLPRIMRGTGTAVVSTCRGVMSAEDARTAGLGGEVLCAVW